MEADERFTLALARTLDESGAPDDGVFDQTGESTRSTHRVNCVPRLAAPRVWRTIYMPIFPRFCSPIFPSLSLLVACARVCGTQG